MMDPITTILAAGGATILKKSIEKVMDRLFRGRKKTVTTKEKRQIELVAERMIQAATMDDIRRYDPAYHRLTVAVRSAPAKKAAACKNAIPKKAWAVRKSAAKRVGVKQAAPKKLAAKKR